MELLSNVKQAAYKIFFLVLFYSILLWFSIFLYGVTYYLYIPAVAHIRPIYFQYSIGQCSSSRKFSSSCPFPSANMSLLTKTENDLLSRGQYYAIEIVLEMPESERNRKQGMFMIKLNMLSEHGKPIQSSSRPALLHYKSTFLKYLHTLFYAPGLLAGTTEEKQEIVIPLFEQYEEDRYQRAHFIHIEVQAENIEIYRAQLRIHAQFTGLRYFMYYWPLFSAAVGVCVNFFFVSITVLITWLRYLMVNGQTDPISIPNPLLKQKIGGKSKTHPRNFPDGKKKLPLKTKKVRLEEETVSSSTSDIPSLIRIRKAEEGDLSADLTKDIDFEQSCEETFEDVWSDTSDILSIPSEQSPLRKRKL